jgi:MFS family permease
MMSVPVVPTLVLSPLLGFWSDRREKRGLFLLLSCLLACGSFLWLLLTNKDTSYYIVLVPLFMSQLSYCVFVSNMWPALSILMKTSSKSIESEEDDRSGRNSLAIGILSGATNVALAVSPVIIGYVLDSTFYPNKDVLSYITMTGPG